MIAGLPLSSTDEVLTFLKAQLAHYEALLAQSKAHRAHLARIGNDTQDRVTVLENTVTELSIRLSRLEMEGLVPFETRMLHTLAKTNPSMQPNWASDHDQVLIPSRIASHNQAMASPIHRPAQNLRQTHAQMPAQSQGFVPIAPLPSSVQNPNQHWDPHSGQNPYTPYPPPNPNINPAPDAGYQMDPDLPPSVRDNFLNMDGGGDRKTPKRE
jgi:hypothetical protein